MHLMFSNGWLDNFKVRWGLRVFKPHGESGDADFEGMDPTIPEI